MTMDNDSVTPTSTIVDDISVPPATVTWAAATELALISIEGPDAVKFLQGQVTCDVEELAQGVTRLGAQCNPKGRMLISFRALQPAPERILLRMHRGLIESALLSLGKYIVFSKAKLFDRSSDYRPIIIHGPEAGERVKRIWGSAPQANNEWQEIEGDFIIRVDDCSFECWLTAGAAADKWPELAGAMVTTGANTATLFAIRQGLGEVRPDTRELFTPQGLNYQLVNGISFRKGCYTGQEIVARLHYRATLKRHMYRVKFPLNSGDRLPQPGSPVVTQAQQTIGEIVMAAYAGPEIAEALAIIADEHLAHALLPGSPVKKLSPLPLPYAIPTEDNN